MPRKRSETAGAVRRLVTPSGPRRPTGPDASGPTRTDPSELRPALPPHGSVAVVTGSLHPVVETRQVEKRDGAGLGNVGEEDGKD